MVSFSFPNGLPAPDARPDILANLDEHQSVICFVLLNSGKEHFWEEYVVPDMNRYRQLGTSALDKSAIWAEIEACMGQDKTEGFVFEIDNITDY